MPDKITSDSYLPRQILESRVKEYILQHEEVRIGDLVSKFGSSYRRINKCLGRAGICLLPRRWYSETRVLREYNKGLSVKEISDKLQTGLSYVYVVLTRLEKDFKGRASGKKKKSYSVRDKLLKKGYSQSEVARREGGGIGRAAIYEYLERNPKVREEWEEKRGKK